MRKIYIVVVLVVISVFLLTGCGLMAAASEYDELIENVLYSINEGDYTEYQDSFLDEVADSDDFIPALKQIDEYIDGDITEFKKTGFYTNTSVLNGKTEISTDLTYSVVTTKDEYVLEVTMYSEDKNEEQKIMYFSVSMAEDQEEE